MVGDRSAEAVGGADGREGRRGGIRFSPLDALLRPCRDDSAADGQQELAEFLEGVTAAGSQVPVAGEASLEAGKEAVAAGSASAPGREAWEAASRCSIRVRQGELEIEVSGPMGFVVAHSRELLERFLPASSRGRDAARRELAEALNEFLSRLAVRGHPETLLALVCFLSERGHSPVSVADVEACYRLIGLPLSANFHADFRSLLRRGLVAEVPRDRHGRKAWVITEEGLAHLHGKLRS